MLVTTCPSRETLFRYSVGLASEEQSDELADHLGSCPDCQATILTLADADDTLIHRLRMPIGSESYLAEPQFQTAVADAIARPDWGADEQEASDDAGGAAIPKTLGEYQLLEELGRGGMGRVYKALQTKLDRVVALKVLPRDRVGNRQAITRFEREMKAVGKLAHPNIVQAYDAREIDDTPVLIMEFVDGLDLAEMVRRFTHQAPRDGFHHAERDEHGVPIAGACELVRRTALALQCAHEHGLVHRDIKPSNVMLARSGEVKLLDLGLARFYAEGGGSRSPASAEEMTDTGQAMGTADYMAPEQASDSRSVDIRADIYSLGCTFYKLLSGRAPFSGAAYRSTLDKLNAHVRQAVPPIRDFVPEVPEELAAILDRMLAKDPAARFATPAEVAAALEPFCKDANLVALVERAMANDDSPLSCQEGASDGPLSCRERVRVRASTRRSILRRILIGLGFLGAIGAAFAAGVIITINRDGKKTTVEVEDGSKARVTAEGLEVTLPGQANPAEQVQQLRSFGNTDPLITTDGITCDEDGWRIEVNGNRTVKLFEISGPGVEDCRLIYRAKMMGEVFPGKAYLEMCCRIPGGGEYSSRCQPSPVRWMTGWHTYETSLFLKKGERPDLIKLNLITEGKGPLWIKDVELLKGPNAATSAPAASAPGQANPAEQANQPAAEAQIKIFTIVNGDAQELSQALAALFSGRAKASGAAGGKAPLVPLRFAVDARTNQVIVSGSAADLDIVEAILTKLDEGETRHHPAQPPATSAAPAAKDESAIQGTWEVVSSKSTYMHALWTSPAVRDHEEEVKKTTKIVITADTFKVVGEYLPVMLYEYQLSPEANPKIIDLRIGDRNYHGIYKREGNQLTICVTAFAQRPTQFFPEFGSQTELLVLRRVSDAAVAADDGAIQGAWQVESASDASLYGGPPSKGLVELFPAGKQVEFSRNRVTLPHVGSISSQSQVINYGLDPFSHPKKFDLDYQGSDTCFRGSYELEGDRLTIGWEADPTGKSYHPPSILALGGNTVLVVLKRTAKTTEKGPADNPAADFKALQGRWKVVRVEKGENADASLAAMVGFDGNYESPANLGLGYLSFKNGGMHIFDYTKLASSYFNYVIDPTPAKKTIDLHDVGGGSVTALGIYEIDGDRLKLRLAKLLPQVKAEQRPRQFAIQRDSGDILVSLQRDHLSDDEKAIEGQWNVIRLLADGKPASSEQIRSLTGTFKDNYFRSVMTERRGRVDGQFSVLSGQYVVDAAKQPKTITMREDGGYLSETRTIQQIVSIYAGGGLVHGTQRIQRLLGIYNLDGDRLTIAYRLNGPRPEKFESTPGSGVTLLDLQRPKAQAGTVGAQTPGAPVSANSASATAPPDAALPEVAVVRPMVRQITHHADSRGFLEAAQTAEVRARVSGRLTKVLFQPGAMVKQGDVLFEIDSAPFQAEQEKREAEVRLAQLRLNRATAVVADAKARAIKDKSPAPNERWLEEQQALQSEAEAALAAAQQGLKLAKLNLASTRLTAPISGRIGRPLIALGSMVTDAMPLAAIDSVDPMCVSFYVPESVFLPLRRNPPRLHGESALPVLVGLNDEQGYPHKSKVESAETRIEAGGNARWRALLPNPDGFMMPGMVVRVRLVMSDPYQALLVPENVIFDKSRIIRDVQTPGQQYSGKPQISVFIVTEQNVVQGRDVEIGPDDDGMRIVEKGLNADDWVVEYGLEGPAMFGMREARLRQGMTVTPKKPPPVSPPATNAKPPAPGSVELKLYGGKTFEQWRDLARTDLDNETRVKAYQALGVFAGSGKSDEAATAILEAMKVDQRPDALKAAYGALRMTGSQGEAAIVSGIRHKDTRHRQAAVEALENDYSRNTYAVPALIEALGDSEPLIRRRVGHALEHIAVATEFEFKNDGSRIHVRPEGEIGPTTKLVVPALCRLLKDSESWVRVEAVQSLGRIGPLAKASIPDLIAFVEGAFSKVKVELAQHARMGAEVELRYGVEALGGMGSAASAAVPLLTAIKELDFRNVLNVKGAAEEALDKIQRKADIKPDSVHPEAAKPGQAPPPRAKGGRETAEK